MVDPCEDNCRMKHKLNKNPVGLDYLPNFLRQTLIGHNEATDQMMSSLRGHSHSASNSNSSSMNDLTTAATSKATVLTASTSSSLLNQSDISINSDISER